MKGAAKRREDGGRIAYTSASQSQRKGRPGLRAAPPPVRSAPRLTRPRPASHTRRMAAGSAPGGRRVGLREVAQAAKVCLMTASLSLRDHPKISKPTRQRVRQIAEQLGYRPDPQIAQLMGRLRASRMVRGSVVVGMISLRTDAAGVHPYDALVRRGLTRRADELGLSVSLFRLSEYRGELKRLIRVVQTRGIRGVVLLPSPEPIALDPTIEWDGLSVVAATTSISSPRFHQVVPNQLYNMMQLIERLHKRGLTRIVAILDRSLEERTHHNYSLALSWHGHRRRILLLPDETPAAERDRRIEQWLQRHQPDVVLAQHADQIAKFLTPGRTTRKAGEVELVSLAGRSDTRIPYQDQLPELIGVSAMSLLAGMIHTNETGIPAHPQITTIDGVIRERAG